MTKSLHGFTEEFRGEIIELRKEIFANSDTMITELTQVIKE